MNTFNLQEFLGRSTDQEFSETTLAKILAPLPSLSPTGPWLAGGALRRTLLQQEPESDFDFFFRDADQLNEFMSALKAKGLSLVRETEHHMHLRGTLEGSEIPVDIQCIRFAFYTDARAVVDSFDFTICQFCFDGTTLTTGEHSLWDLGRKRLALRRLTYPVSSMRRVLKYTKQGFNACAGCLASILRETAANPEFNLEIEYVD